MSLSDEERKRLEQLEQDLAATDPELSLELQSGQPRRMAARSVRGILAAVAGFALVIAGIATRMTMLGVIGFLLMSMGAYWFFSGVRPGGWSGFPL